MINKRHLSILNQIKESGGEIDSGKPNDSVMLIDGMNLFIRVFSAIPTTNEDGVHVGGIVGFLRSLAFSINMIRPTRTIVVFDGKGGSNRRRKIFPQYKMGRKMSYRLNRGNEYLTRNEEQQMMIRQLNRVVEYLECLPITIVNMENNEVVDGYASEISEYGAFVRIGPMEALLHKSQILDEPINVNLGIKRIEGASSGKFLEEGSYIRSRVVSKAINQNDPRASKIGLNCKMDGLGSYTWIQEQD